MSSSETYPSWDQPRTCSFTGLSWRKEKGLDNPAEPRRLRLPPGGKLIFDGLPPCEIFFLEHLLFSIFFDFYRCLFAFVFETIMHFVSHSGFKFMLLWP